MQDRPAGGTAEEVAAANPHLVDKIPSMVGHINDGGSDDVNAAAAAAFGGVGSDVGGAPVDMVDGSGMEVPELAMQVGWSH